MSQSADDGVREVRPFDLDFRKDHDADFMPKIVKVDDAEDEADPKGSSAPEPADYSDLAPELEMEESELSGATATHKEKAPVARVITPPKVPSPGKPAS